MPKIPANPLRADLEVYTRKLLITVGVVALAWVLFLCRHVVLLAFGACLVALALRAAADPVRRRTPLGPGASLAVTVMAVVAGLGALTWFVGAQVSRQLAQLEATLPAAWAATQKQIGAYSFGGWLLTRIHQAAGAPMAGLGPLAGRIGHVTGLGVQALGELVVVLVAGVYFAVQPALYRDGLLSLAPSRVRPGLTEVAEEAATALRKWLLGTAIAMAVMGVLIAVGTSLLGLPAPVALGLLSGVAEFVPIVGAAVSAIPGLLVAATQGPQMVLWTLLFYVAAHQLEGHVLIPLIQRRVVAVPPALTLFSVVGFGVLFGPSGIIFATPLAVVVMVLLRRLSGRRPKAGPA
jgi:predicted PurR-regulated permease PerM